MTDRLVEFLRRKFPPERTIKLQAWNIVLGIAFLPIVPFVPIRVGVIIINVISCYTLVVAGLAGLDSARQP